LVDGSLECTRAGFPSADDAVSPGMFVPEWDDGRIAVGNGDAESHWVHDDVRVGHWGCGSRLRRTSLCCWPPTST
jgi:hypothetical protein